MISISPSLPFIEYRTKSAKRDRTGGREERAAMSCVWQSDSLTVWHPHSPHYTPYCFALLTLNTTLTRVSSKFHQILSFSQLKHLLGMALIRTRRYSPLSAPALHHNLWVSRIVQVQTSQQSVVWMFRVVWCSDISNNYSYSHYFIISVLRPSGLQMATNNSSHKLVWHDPL